MVSGQPQIVALVMAMYTAVFVLQLTISARLEITRPRVVSDLGEGGEGGGSMVMSYDVIDPNYDVMQQL